MAPQHRRGGKHAVKDEDLTHTKYDDYNREQLLAAVKEADCYVKDDKKSVMARKLAEHDRHLQNKERRAAQERKEKEDMRQQEIKDSAKAQRSRRRARAKRNEERGIQRERGIEASSNSDDTDEERNRCNVHKLTVTGGKALSDESWEDTCSETTIRSDKPPVHPGCRLRLFEWPYMNSPLLVPSSDSHSEQHPAALTYAPLKLITTHSHGKVTLPGQKYPAGVDPDFVPILDPLTRSAARYGHMIGLLAHAIVEPATSWATRTIVQGWNGCMYFSLPAQHDAKNFRLDTVYRKWNIENSKLLQPTPGVTDVKADRKRRFAQRLANKRKAVSEVYEGSKWRPLALGYLPAYLDWEAGLQRGDSPDPLQTIENLFYIRFPSCDLPHYYFWARKGEWCDPTIPDPLWSNEVFEQQHTVESVADACNVSLSKKFRVKKLTTPPARNFACFRTEYLEYTVSSVENDLVTYGLPTTLAKNRTLAVSANKEQAWSVFTSRLPYLYPSGKLPRAPPVEPAKGMYVAEKIAALLSGRGALPYNGKEEWTTRDDDFWDVVSHADTEDVLTLNTDSLGATQDLFHPLSATNDANDGVDDALHRRDSMDILPSPSDQRIWAWLDTISPSLTPCIIPYSPTTVDPEAKPISPLDFDLNAPGTFPTCPFCNTPWTHLPSGEQAAHMLSHSHISPLPTTSTSNIVAIGVGAKRRHSLLSVRTLHSYHVNYGKGRKMLRVDSTKGLVDGWAKLGTVDSPFTKEVRRARRAKKAGKTGARAL